MEPKKITRKPESRKHKIQSALRFLTHLHEEIRIAQKLEDIQDKVILDKFKEHIEALNEDFLSDH